MGKCKHDTLFRHSFGISILYSPDDDTKIIGRIIHVSVVCDVCGTKMKIVGTPLGVPAIEFPTSDLDADVVSVPIAPEEQKDVTKLVN